MSPKDLTTLRNIFKAFHIPRIRLREAETLPPEFANLNEEIAAYARTCQHLWETVSDQIIHSDVLADEASVEADLTETEVKKLLTLNRQLAGIHRHLMAVSEDVRYRMDKKIADPEDPMIDYEIEAKIDYILRNDDPEFAIDDDNIITSRSVSIKHLVEDWTEIGNMDFADSFCPEPLKAEPHCLDFHDLYEHSYSPEYPNLGFRNCLRIGQILIDAQVWQQYSFDVDKGKWSTRWGRCGD